MFAPFSIISTSLFRASFSHRFVIDFGMDVGLIFDVFLIPSPFTHATCSTFKTIAFTLNVYVYPSEKHEGWWLCRSFSISIWAFIWDVFWHRCRLHVGILLPYISVFGGLCFFMIFWMLCFLNVLDFLSENEPKILRRSSGGVHHPHPLGMFWRRHRSKDVFFMELVSFLLDFRMILKVCSLGAWCYFSIFPRRFHDDSNASTPTPTRQL